MEMAIETFNLTKKYNTKVGCAEICLRVPRGQIFGFLGPNGAGKSTLVKILVGLLFPTSGKALVLNKPLGDMVIREGVGFLPENFRYHDWLTGRQLLEFHASLYRLRGTEKSKRIGEVLELVGLDGKEKQKIQTFSKGMRQRVGLACALLADPELLFLDEPTSALDPIGRRNVREILLNLRAAGKTIFLNSHLLSEVEMVCDAVAFIRQGKIIRQGTMNELQSGEIEVEMKVGGLTQEMVGVLSALARSLEIKNDRVQVRLKNEEDIPRLAAAVVTGGGALFEMVRKRSTLEELFINTTGRGEGQC
jgi:ABC-2 type transport system ATP-binding protein